MKILFRLFILLPFLLTTPAQAQETSCEEYGWVHYYPTSDLERIVDLFEEVVGYGLPVFGEFQSPFDQRELKSTYEGVEFCPEDPEGRLPRFLLIDPVMRPYAGLEGGTITLETFDIEHTSEIVNDLFRVEPEITETESGFSFFFEDTDGNNYIIEEVFLSE